MDNKFLDDVGLKHLWDKITSTFAKKNEVEASIEASKKVFVITATADFVSSTITNVSHSFEDIISAYERNEHIILNLDISQMMPNCEVSLPLTLNMGTEVSFSATFLMDYPTSGTAGIRSDGNNYLILHPLVPQTQISGLTLTTAENTPANPDSNIITFVDEG